MALAALAKVDRRILWRQAPCDRDPRLRKELRSLLLKITLDRCFHLAEIEWHGFATTDLLDAVVHVLDELCATPQQADRIVEGLGSIVIQAAGDGPDEKLFVFR